MKNSEQFLSSFNSIEKFLRDVTNSQNYISFYHLINKAKKVKNISSIINTFESDLKKFSDLRNTIVHENTGDYVIAEPHDDIVSKIRKIKERLTDPPKAVSVFQCNVHKFHTHDSISSVLVTMHKKRFSQFPIYDESAFVGLLTENTIARWLAACVTDDIFSLKETLVKDVIKFEENKNNYMFLSRKSTLYDILDSFNKYERNGNRIEAILLTENGKLSEKPLGIITIWDLPKIHNILQ